MLPGVRRAWNELLRCNWETFQRLAEPIRSPRPCPHVQCVHCFCCFIRLQSWLARTVVLKEGPGVELILREGPQKHGPRALAVPRYVPAAQGDVGVGRHAQLALVTCAGAESYGVVRALRDAQARLMAGLAQSLLRRDTGAQLVYSAPRHAPKNVYVCSNVRVEAAGTTCSSCPVKTDRSASGPATVTTQARIP